MFISFSKEIFCSHCLSFSTTSLSLSCLVCCFYLFCLSSFYFFFCMSPFHFPFCLSLSLFLLSICLSFFFSFLSVCLYLFSCFSFCLFVFLSLSFLSASFSLSLFFLPLSLSLFSASICEYVTSLFFYCKKSQKLVKIYLSKPDIGLGVRVFANGPGDLGSIPGRVIPKTQKMVLDASLLNTQHYKVRIKGKVEQSREGVAPSPTPWCSSYRKGSLRVTLDCGRQLFYIYLGNFHGSLILRRMILYINIILDNYTNVELS